ncbi:hypothetical protein BS78_02G201100 [Paspalum vaginatum]|nr:hypothetical protein BS78_02G201100 [Paspalum vaginatum]
MASSISLSHGEFRYSRVFLELGHIYPAGEVKVRLRGLLSGSRSPRACSRWACLLVISDQASIPLTSICIYIHTLTTINCSSSLFASLDRSDVS